MVKLVDTQAVWAFLKGAKIKPKRPSRLFGLLESKAANCVGLGEHWIEEAKRLEIKNLPKAGPKRVNILRRAILKQYQLDFDYEQELAQQLDRPIMRYWYQGKQSPCEDWAAPVTFKGEKRYFPEDGVNKLTKLIDAQALLAEVSLIDRLPRVAPPAPNEKYSRNKFIDDICEIWVLELDQKFSFSTGTGARADEARGKMADFIMVVTSQVLSARDLTRGKLRDYLKRNQRKIKSQIERVRPATEHIIRWHDLNERVKDAAMFGGIAQRAKLRLNLEKQIDIFSTNRDPFIRLMRKVEREAELFNQEHPEECATP